MWKMHFWLVTEMKIENVKRGMVLIPTLAVEYLLEVFVVIDYEF